MKGFQAPRASAVASTLQVGKGARSRPPEDANAALSAAAILVTASHTVSPSDMTTQDVAVDLAE